MKWEYCYLKLGWGGGFTQEPNGPALLKCTSKGSQVIKTLEQKAELFKLTEADQLVWQLGQEGWELVGTPNNLTLWFKRPVS